MPLELVIKIKWIGTTCRENKRLGKNLNLAWEQKKLDHEGDGDTNRSYRFWNIPQEPEEETLWTGDYRRNWNPDRPQHYLKQNS